MTLRLSCPVCRNRMTIDLQDGVILCKRCGYQPMHEWRRLAPEASHSSIRPLHVKSQIAAHGEFIKCPHCGDDDLRPIAGQDAIRCQTCHTVYPIKTEGTLLSKSLRGVLLKRHGRAIIWEATGRILDCGYCGAQITLAAEELAEACPFCGSRQAVVQDRHQSFDAPDGLLSFQIAKDEVRPLVEAKLKSGLHGLMQPFRGKIVRITGRPLYLPWWQFDVTVDIYWRYVRVAGMNGTDTDIIHPDPIYAALAHRDEISQLLPYDLRKLRPYEPQSMAAIQAELPQVKLQEAAPVAIQLAIKQAERLARRRHPVLLSFPSVSGDLVRSRLNLTSHARQVGYKLLLLPAYLVLLHEKDGDTRRVLMNGQTGEIRLEGGALWGALADSGRRRRQQRDRGPSRQ
jgi:Zn finger protein HypA/HybF involved in hydrogenase expression